MIVGLLGAACSSSSGDDAAQRPSIVVTTNILGDIVSNVVGDQVEVSVVMPLGADPHDFAPSARQATEMEQADLLVINGAGFEAGMGNLIANVADAGTPIFTAANEVELLNIGDGETPDPHIWTDPDRMSDLVEPLVDAIVAADMVDDVAALRASGDRYAETLLGLGVDMDDVLSSIPDDTRVLVTNHEVFVYFADRFDFEVIGAVIPSSNPSAEPSAAEIEDLAELIDERGVPAVFGETTQSTQLAEALVDEVGSDVQVIELFSESLDEPGTAASTYVGMMTTNAQLIAAGLGG